MQITYLLKILCYYIAIFELKRKEQSKIASNIVVTKFPDYYYYFNYYYCYYYYYYFYFFIIFIIYSIK